MRMVQPGTEHSNTILADILSQAERNPGHPAISVNGTATSYHELAITIRRFAACFAEIPRPCVMIVMPRCADAYAAMLGALLCGGYYVPVNNETTEASFRYITSTIKPDFIVSQPEVAHTLPNAEFNPLHIDPSKLPANSLQRICGAEPDRLHHVHVWLDRDPQGGRHPTERPRQLRRLDKIGAWPFVGGSYFAELKHRLRPERSRNLWLFVQWRHARAGE